MNDGIPFEMRLSLSKCFPPGVSDICFGRYSLKPLPSSDPEWSDALLSFVDTFKEPEAGGSNPEEEAINICRLLSLLLNMRVKRGAIRVNAVDLPASYTSGFYSQFFGKMDPSELNADLERVLALPPDLSRQFLRSCHSYSFALEFIPTDITFAFFLLFVAVECLSSQNYVISHSELDPSRRNCDRFCKFIDTYLPKCERGEDEQNEKLFRELLKTTYYSHRSGFAHGGKEVSTASLMADRAKSSYFKHEVNGKEVRTPAVGWFSRIVRSSLIGYLRGAVEDQIHADEYLLARLAFEKACLRVKAKRSSVRGAPVKFADIEYR